MTAKDKALELIDKMNSVDLNCKTLDSLCMLYPHAIECVLIAVDEIINSNPHSNPFNTELYSTMDYWLEVKNEINKL